MSFIQMAILFILAIILGGMAGFVLSVLRFERFYVSLHKASEDRMEAWERGFVSGAEAYYDASVRVFLDTAKDTTVPLHQRQIAASYLDFIRPLKSRILDAAKKKPMKATGA